MQTSFTITLLLACLCTAQVTYYLVDEMNVNGTYIYYPFCALTSSANGCATNSLVGSNFPVVVIAQGVNVDAQYYAGVASVLASFGAVVAVPNAPFLNLGFGPPAQYSTPQILYGAYQLVSLLNSTVGNPIYALAATANVYLLGHSYGGYTAIIAASSNGPDICREGEYSQYICNGWNGIFPGLKGVVTWGGAIFYEGEDDDPLPNTTIPISLLLGGNDGVTSASDVNGTYYDINPPKSYIVLAGANHYGITLIQNPPGASGDPSTQTVSQVWSNVYIGLISRLFYLATTGDSSSINALYTTKVLPINSTTVVKSCKVAPC